MAKRRRTAVLEKTLVYLDEPQLLLLKAREVVILAVAVDHEEYEFPFLATTVSHADWRKYLDNAVDLRYLFEYGRPRHLYFFDLYSLRNDNSVVMEPWQEEVPDKFLPDHRFFARDHTEAIATESPVQAVQAFDIDGNWEMSEFSKFYGQYCDIYALIHSLKKLVSQDTSGNMLRRLTEVFTNYPWRGGTSYMHFFNDLGDLLQLDEKPSINKVRYASPGEVEIKGSHDAFEDANSAIENYINYYEQINEQYQKLHAFLSERKYLTLSADRFDNDDAIADYISLETAELARLMKLPEFNTLRKACGDNALVTAKVVLAYCRRVDNTFSFFAEGRVAFGN